MDRGAWWVLNLIALFKEDSALLKKNRVGASKISCVSFSRTPQSVSTQLQGLRLRQGHWNT